MAQSLSTGYHKDYESSGFMVRGLAKLHIVFRFWTVNGVVRDRKWGAPGLSLIIGSSQRLKEYENCQHIGLTIASSQLNYSNSYNYLGIEIDSTLSWNLVITNVCKKLRSSLSALQQLSHTVPFLQDPLAHCLLLLLSVSH